VLLRIADRRTAAREAREAAEMAEMDSSHYGGSGLDPT
jgi:hypothetical protein